MGRRDGRGVGERDNSGRRNIARGDHGGLIVLPTEDEREGHGVAMKKGRRSCGRSISRGRCMQLRHGPIWFSWRKKLELFWQRSLRSFYARMLVCPISKERVFVAAGSYSGWAKKGWSCE